MSFNYQRLGQLKSIMKSAQFVPMDPSMAGGQPPMDPSMAGGPPPMDPAMMGGQPPMDPAMMGGLPPMDPAMMGEPPAPDAGADVSPSGEPYMKITPTQLSKLFKQFAEVFKSVLGVQGSALDAASTPAQAPRPDAGLQSQLAEVNAKMDAILGLGR